MNFTSVTCTGDRPEAYALSEKYLARQLLKPAQMLVLDDGEIPVVPTLGQDYHYWPEMRGRGSMVKKLRRALDDGLIKGDAIVFIEDDDWFAPDYLAWLAAGLSKFSLFGEGRALYYTVRWRIWFEHVNMAHASLCSTAIRRDGFAWLTKQCAVSDEPFLDVRLWERAPLTKQVADPYRDPSRKRRTVGIKAMPGRGGYGGGHRGRDRSAADDPQLVKLRSLIGDDADAYAEFYSPSTMPAERNGFTGPPMPSPPMPAAMNAREYYEQWRAKNPIKRPNA